MSRFVIVSLLLCGMTMWAVALNCQSCGQECLPACGTRYFKTCCFNYLRRKRGSLTTEMFASPSLSLYELPFNPKFKMQYLDTWTPDPMELYESSIKPNLLK